MSNLPPSSSFNQQNPYQSPQAPGPAISGEVEADERLLKMLRDFRSQIVALGAFWIIIGVIAAGLGVLAGGAVADSDRTLGTVLLAILVGFGMLWITLGALVCLKQMWALYVALALSYLSLVSSVLRLQVCSIVLLIVVIVQAHRVLRWAKELTAARIPLTSRPADLLRTGLNPGN
jgi:hypothetical protein